MNYFKSAFCHHPLLIRSTRLNHYYLHSICLPVSGWQTEREILSVCMAHLFSLCSWLECTTLWRLPWRLQFRSNCIRGEFPAPQYVGRQIRESKRAYRSQGFSQESGRSAGSGRGAQGKCAWRGKYVDSTNV